MAMKDDINVVKVDVKGMKDDMKGMKDDMKGMKDEIEAVKGKVSRWGETFLKSSLEYKLGKDFVVSLIVDSPPQLFLPYMSETGDSGSITFDVADAINTLTGRLVGTI